MYHDNLSAENKTKAFSKLGRMSKLAEAKSRLANCISADRAFQREALEDYAFYAGHQWKPQEKYILEHLEKRPALTFNLIKVSIDLIMGVNEGNRVLIKPEPVEPADRFLADILWDTDTRICEIGEFESIEDDAFENALVCGRGFVALDVRADPKNLGEVVIDEISVPTHEIRFDPAAVKPDMSDARYMFWDKWLTFEEFKVRYPDKAKRLDEIVSGDVLLPEGYPDDIGDVWSMADEPADDTEYERPLDIEFYDKSRGRVRLCHMEYVEEFRRYYGINPATGKPEEFEKGMLQELKAAIPGFEYMTVMDTKTRWFQFIGDEVLFDDDSPMPFDGFSVTPVIAYRDKSGPRVQHFGVVRMQKDPQREVNKRWSQTLNLLMKQGQGGYFVEEGTAVDEQQWYQSIYEAGATTWVTKDSLATGRILPKQLPEFPRASMNMEEYAQSVMKRISGVNEDLLGLDRGREDAGVVVRLRQQQGVTLLNRLFKNYKRMKKIVAEKRFAIIAAFMPDDQIRKILGEGKRYVFRGGLVVDKENGFLAPLRNVRDLKYNIVTTEAPTNLTKTMFELSIFMEMMAKGFPVDPVVVIDKLELSAADKENWKRFILERQEQEAQQAQEAVQAQAMGVQHKMMQTQAKMETDRAKLMLQAQKDSSTRDLELKRIARQLKKDDRDYAIDLAELDAQDRQMVLDFIARLKGGQNREVSKPAQIPYSAQV